MTTNVNPDTGIAYGYISAHSLEDYIIEQMQQGREPYYEEELASHLSSLKANLEFGNEIDEKYLDADGDLDEDAATEDFSEAWQPDEPIHEGEIDVPGYGKVEYRTSWLGGALNVWIFKSPFMTSKAGKASPCVPNAGILDRLDGDVTAYDVPADWRTDFGHQVEGLEPGVRP